MEIILKKLFRELCSLKRCDVKSIGESGQVTVFGKGGKTRAFLLPVALFRNVQVLRGDRSHDDPVFMSRKNHGHLDLSMVMRIVRAAAVRGEIEGNVSPHERSLYISHVPSDVYWISDGISHRTITLVQSTLGHSNRYLAVLILYR